MSKVNLLNHLETRGVDMKSNPILIGNKKLHAATNLMWDEGVVRSRYGFRYFPLEIEGQFQGAGRYDPTKGISVGTFSDTEPGLLVVSEGAVFYKADNHCKTERISNQIFCGKGDVNVYQAENYMIFQNLETDTYWWNGEGDIVKSPGMEEQDWNDPELPTLEIEPVIPVASIPPDCENFDYSKILVDFQFIDDVTEKVIPNVNFIWRKNANVIYRKVSNSGGRLDFKVTKPGTFRYDATIAGYDSRIDVVTEITQSESIVVRMVPTYAKQVLSVRVQMLGHLDDDLRVVYVSPTGVRTTLQDLRRNIGVYAKFNGISFVPFLDVTFTRAQLLEVGVEMVAGGAVEVSAFDGWAGAYTVAPYNLFVTYATGVVEYLNEGPAFLQRNSTNAVTGLIRPDPNPKPPGYFDGLPYFDDYRVLGTHYLSLP